MWAVILLAVVALDMWTYGLEARQPHFPLGCFSGTPWYDDFWEALSQSIMRVLFIVMIVQIVREQPE